MILNKIINQVNKLVSNNSSFKLSYDKLEFYLNKSVDNINRFLQTRFRTPEEYFEDSKFYYSVLKHVNNQNSIIYISEAFSIDKKELVDMDPLKSVHLYKKFPYFYDPKEKKIYNFNGNYSNNPIVDYESPIEENVSYLFYIINLDIFVLYDGTSFSEITSSNAYSEYNITLYNNVNDLIDIYDYNEFPDAYIRSCLIYYTAALYLEEEDEVESQYSMYLKKAEDELVSWRKKDFSCYNTCW